MVGDLIEMEERSVLPELCGPYHFSGVVAYPSPVPSSIECGTQARTAGLVVGSLSS